MLYSDNSRVHYRRPQLMEVVCQLRFPAILSIGAREPADFQEAVRAMFPRYAAKQEQPPPGSPARARPTPGWSPRSPSPITTSSPPTASGS